MSLGLLALRPSKILIRLSPRVHHFSMPPKKKRSADNGDASADPPAKLNKTTSDYSEMKFDCAATTKNGGKSCNFKVSTWNVDGLRAWIKKGGLDFLSHERPDVICLQETKCSEAKLPDEVKQLEDYPHRYWHASSEKEGYSGVALLSKTEPLHVHLGLAESLKEDDDREAGKEFDVEGRLITAEFPEFYLVSTYVPNAGRKLVTLDKRMKWDPLLRKLVQELDSVKPVVLCGDLNVAHKEIDLANPKTNKKSAGFTQEERDGFSELLDCGFADVYRHFYPDKDKVYTFWTYMMNARAKNVGWRLDYFVVSKRLLDDRVCDCCVRDQVFGSDHCPSTLMLHV